MCVDIRCGQFFIIYFMKGLKIASSRIDSETLQGEMIAMTVVEIAMVVEIPMTTGTVEIAMMTEVAETMIVEVGFFFTILIFQVNLSLILQTLGEIPVNSCHFSFKLCYDRLVDLGYESRGGGQWRSSGFKRDDERKDGDQEEKGTHGVIAKRYEMSIC